MELAVDRLEGVGYAGNLFHDIQAADHIHIDFIGIADQAEHHAEFALGNMHAYALVLQPVDEHFSPFGGCIRLENCDHFYLPRFEIISVIKNKNRTEWNLCGGMTGMIRFDKNLPLRFAHHKLPLLLTEFGAEKVIAVSVCKTEGNALHGMRTFLIKDISF